MDSFIDRKNIEVEVCVEMSVLASPELKKGKMLSLCLYVTLERNYF